ncbi:hypothetical protein C8D70_12516 [Chryseobacterium sp. CBTAP 102]|uniref:hypothetical protein n=1 Tax=Chryseobacterium sp. CBTAP 102 TaxID=2135644 RepID=UPI000D773C7D|nr:hypothetical protein [Chryseobacterium sp. CBTAP 102]PXW06484.1 hypothetical protein C8D70_12516 [Chryseobacterium sp. CBTAP 102]
METGSYLLSNTYSVENNSIYFFEATVYTKKFGGVFIEKKYWYGYNIDWFQKWNWYFKYCAALLQIKYPRYDVDIKWGAKKPELVEDFNILKQRKAKQDITTCKRMITKYENAILQYKEIEQLKLIPDWENPKYLKALTTLDKYKDRLSELINVTQ